MNVPAIFALAARLFSKLQVGQLKPKRNQEFQLR